jgi:SAM-dependent methyltransferase
MAEKAPSASRRILDAVALLDPRPCERLLEIGCGTGQAIEAVLLYQPMASVMAIDRSQTAVDRARTVNAEAIADGRVSILLGDIDKGPVEPGNFDRVFAIRVNSFWTKPGLALPHVIASLRPGGEAWIIYDEPLPKIDGPILQSMRELGMEGVRGVPGNGGAWALVARRNRSDSS